MGSRKKTNSYSVVSEEKIILAFTDLNDALIFSLEKLHLVLNTIY